MGVADKEKPVPELVQNTYYNIQSKEVKVYSAWPFIEATQALYGTRDNQQFPILPGSHVPAAWKSYSFFVIYLRQKNRNICIVVLH